MSVVQRFGFWVVLIGAREESRHVTELSAQRRDRVVNSRRDVRVTSSALFIQGVATSGSVDLVLRADDGTPLLTDSGQELTV